MGGYLCRQSWHRALSFGLKSNLGVRLVSLFWWTMSRPIPEASMEAGLKKLEGLSMPRFSWDYEDCSEADHWFLTARAYLESSCHLLSSMVEGRANDTFHHMKVAASLLIHSVELFLKGGISQAGKKVPALHHLDQLHGQFSKLYPGKNFEFSAALAQLVQPSRRAPHNEFPRYPTDQSGLPWQGCSHFDLVVWFEQATKFLNDFKRLEPLMKKRYGLS
jgi:HEPN domain-containing protein